MPEPIIHIISTKPPDDRFLAAIANYEQSTRVLVDAINRGWLSIPALGSNLVPTVPNHLKSRMIDCHEDDRLKRIRAWHITKSQMPGSPLVEMARRLAELE